MYNLGKLITLGESAQSELSRIVENMESNEIPSIEPFDENSTISECMTIMDEAIAMNIMKSESYLDGQFSMLNQQSLMESAGYQVLCESVIGTIFNSVKAFFKKLSGFISGIIGKIRGSKFPNTSMITGKNFYGYDVDFHKKNQKSEYIDAATVKIHSRFINNSFSSDMSDITKVFDSAQNELSQFLSGRYSDMNKTISYIKLIAGNDDNISEEDLDYVARPNTFGLSGSPSYYALHDLAGYLHPLKDLVKSKNDDDDFSVDEIKEALTEYFYDKEVEVDVGDKMGKISILNYVADAFNSKNADKLKNRLVSGYEKIKQEIDKVQKMFANIEKDIDSIDIGSKNPNMSKRITDSIRRNCQYMMQYTSHMIKYVNTVYQFSMKLIVDVIKCCDMIIAVNIRLDDYARKAGVNIDSINDMSKKLSGVGTDEWYAKVLEHYI